MIEIDDPGGFKTSCPNCNRESHFLGTFCWWGVWLFLLMLLFIVGIVTYAIVAA